MNRRPNLNIPQPVLPALVIVISPIFHTLLCPSAPLTATRKRGGDGGGRKVLIFDFVWGSRGRSNSRVVVFVLHPRPPGEARGCSHPWAPASAGAGGRPLAGQGDHQAVLLVPAAGGEPARAAPLCFILPSRVLAVPRAVRARSPVRRARRPRVRVASNAREQRLVRRLS